MEGLFTGRPAAWQLFKVIRAYIESLGLVEVVPTQTQVSFGVKTKFAWVWLPQIWIKKQPENMITPTFDARHRIRDRVLESIPEAEDKGRLRGMKIRSRDGVLSAVAAPQRAKPEIKAAEALARRFSVIDTCPRRAIS